MRRTRFNVRAAAIMAVAVLLTACRQDQILAEAAKFETIQKSLDVTTAAIVAAPPQECARVHARNLLLQRLTPTIVRNRLKNGRSTAQCGGIEVQTKALAASLKIINGYAAGMVRAAKGQTIPDAKVGGLFATFNAANTGASVLPGIKSDDVNTIFNGLEALLDRNLRANQLRHIVREVDGPLGRVTVGLVAIFGNTDNCTTAVTWCAVFHQESIDIEETWGKIASSSVVPSVGGINAPHPPQYFAAQWEMQRRFEDDVKAHDDAVALGPAYADALQSVPRRARRGADRYQCRQRRQHRYLQPVRYLRAPCSQPRSGHCEARGLSLEGTRDVFRPYRRRRRRGRLPHTVRIARIRGDDLTARRDQRRRRSGAQTPTSPRSTTRRNGSPARSMPSRTRRINSPDSPRFSTPQ